MQHEMTEQEKAVSRRAMRGRLYWQHRIITDIRADDAVVRRALLVVSASPDDIETLYTLVGPDGIWAARELLTGRADWRGMEADSGGEAEYLRRG